MTTRTRRLLMVAFVATALAADRAATAAPVLRPQVVDVARRLAGRLVVNLRRVVPAARLRVFCREERITPASPRRFLSVIETLLPFQSSPAEYRLPPPQL